MQIIIPMSGKGERFKKAGYSKPKPLIEINNKPIIAHVLDMFPGEKDVTFICNRDHIETTNMEALLKHYCPTGRVITIEPHKSGPVFAVSKIFDLIDDKKPTIVNYCDFNCYWNYEYFKKWLLKLNPDGCIPAYKGFHPHSLAGNNYAFIREKNGWMTKIQEKKPFTNDKLNEFASSGTYYFANGKILKDFFKKTIDSNLKVNNEYYCSVVYNLMVKESLKVAIFELQHFMQWGTPDDLNEYLSWSNGFTALANYKNSKTIFQSSTLIPMAGKGNRFRKENYKLSKPLIPISGIPMVIQAVKSLPKTNTYSFIALENLFNKNDLNKILNSNFENIRIKLLNKITDGQCSTCLSAINEIPSQQPVTISACDHGVILKNQKFHKMFNDKNIDRIVWVTRSHPEAIRKPEMFGWVQESNNKIIKVSVKKPLGNPKKDPILIGTFTFKKASIFKECAQNLIHRNGRVNGEFYVDSCINDALLLGYKCHVFDVDHYFSWGTPNELRTFEYWQSCFHKWKSHEYSWSRDPWKDELTNGFEPEHLKEINPRLPLYNRIEK